MELIINPTAIVITGNFDEVKASLLEQIKAYDISVTDENLADAKKMATELNKLSDSINRIKIDKSKEFSGPIEEFKTKAMELVNIVQDGREKILKQVRVYEEKFKADSLIVLGEELKKLNSEMEIEPDFQRKYNLDQLAIKTNFTGSGQMTKSAKEKLMEMVSQDRLLQDTVFSRRAALSEIAQRAGLVSISLDVVENFIREPEASYSQKLNQIIDREIKRQKDVEEKIRAEEKAKAEKQQLESKKPEPVAVPEPIIAAPTEPVRQVQQPVPVAKIQPAEPALSTLNKGIEYLSPSKLKRFRTCPFQCKNDQYKRNPSVDFGNAVHKGLAAFYRGDEFLSAYRAEAGRLNVPIEDEQRALKCFEYSEALGVNKDAIITVESEDGEKVLYGNRYAQVEINNEFGFRGGMDLVYAEDDGTLVIRDHKTGQSKDEDDLQLAMYALMAWKKYGSFPTIKTVFDYVEQGFSQTQYWNAETLVGAVEYVIPLAKDYLAAMNTNNWPQTPHKWCKYCSLTANCEAFKKQLECKQDRNSYDIDATIENLPAILEYHAKIKAVADAAYSIEAMMKEKYEKILALHGKVNVAGRTVEIKEKVSRYNYDLAAISVQVEAMIGRQPLEIYEFSSGKAKELRQTLDKDQKKAFDLIVESNREVKSRAKTLSITIAKEAVSETDENGKETSEQ